MMSSYLRRCPTTPPTISPTLTEDVFKTQNISSLSLDDMPGTPISSTDNNYDPYNMNPYDKTKAKFTSPEDLFPTGDQGEPQGNDTSKTDGIVGNDDTSKEPR